MVVATRPNSAVRAAAAGNRSRPEGGRGGTVTYFVAAFCPGLSGCRFAPERCPLRQRGLTAKVAKNAKDGLVG